MDELQNIYIGSIKKLLSRLYASREFLDIYSLSENEIYLESAILQLRKAMELLAFASIAPNKKEYKQVREAAEKNADYRKDYHAKRIIQLLKKINKDFYPVPLLEPQKTHFENFHFERKLEGILTIKQFENLYDQLGKYLHADNPWGVDKNFKSFLLQMPKFLDAIESLLLLYFTVIRTDNLNGIWVVQTTTNPISVRILIASADGDFLVK